MNTRSFEVHRLGSDHLQNLKCETPFPDAVKHQIRKVGLTLSLVLGSVGFTQGCAAPSSHEETDTAGYFDNDPDAYEKAGLRSVMYTPGYFDTPSEYKERTRRYKTIFSHQELMEFLDHHHLTFEDWERAFGEPGLPQEETLEFFLKHQLNLGEWGQLQETYNAMRSSEQKNEDQAPSTSQTAEEE